LTLCWSVTHIVHTFSIDRHQQLFVHVRSYINNCVRPFSSVRPTSV